MARLLDTNVRYFDNTVTTSQLKNEWGSIVSVLDEALINGTNKQNILSIISSEDPDDAAYWLSTIYLNTNHKFVKDIHVVQLENIPDPIYNTVFRVQDVSPNSVTIAFDKTKTLSKPTDFSTLTGATLKIAPLGFSKTYSGDKKAIYKSGSHNPCYLRVDDSCPLGYDPSWLKFARVSMYSDISNFDDINEKPGRLKAPYYPDDPVRAEVPKGLGANGFYGESKWYYATIDKSDDIRENNTPTPADPRPFEILGDEKTFYFFPSLVGNNSWNQKAGYCFGEYINNAVNIYNNILCCHEAYLTANTPDLFDEDFNPGRYEMRNAFGRINQPVGKYILNYVLNRSFLPHAKASFVCPIGGAGLTGRDTGINYNIFNRKLNFLEVSLLGHFGDFTDLIGKMRGYYFIGNNLQDYKTNYLPHKKVVVKKEDRFVILTIFHSWSGADTIYDGWQESRIAFKLNDWD